MSHMISPGTEKSHFAGRWYKSFTYSWLCFFQNTKNTFRKSVRDSSFWSKHWKGRDTLQSTGRGNIFTCCISDNKFWWYSIAWKESIVPQDLPEVKEGIILRQSIYIYIYTFGYRGNWGYRYKPEASPPGEGNIANQATVTKLKNQTNNKRHCRRNEFMCLWAKIPLVLYNNAFIWVFGSAQSCCNHLEILKAIQPKRAGLLPFTAWFVDFVFVKVGQSCAITFKKLTFRLGRWRDCACYCRVNIDMSSIKK